MGGFDLCLDFDCAQDSDPNVAPKRCPNIDWPEENPDGDEDTTAEIEE